MTEAATFAAGVIYIHRRPSRVPTQAQNSGVLPPVYAQVKIMRSFPFEDALGEIKQPRLPHYPTSIPPQKSKKSVYVRLCTGMNRREPVASSTARLPPPVHKRHRSTRHILARRRGHLLPVQRHEGQVTQVKRQPAV